MEYKTWLKQGGCCKPCYKLWVKLSKNGRKANKSRQGIR